jgi:hypothetical protein
MSKLQMNDTRASLLVAVVHEPSHVCVEGIPWDAFKQQKLLYNGDAAIPLFDVADVF